MASLTLPQTTYCAEDRSPSEQLDGIERLIAEERLTEAAEAIREWDDAETTTDNPPQLAVTLARLAHGLENSGESESAAECYRRFIEMTSADAVATLPRQQLNLIRIAAARAMIRGGQYEVAMKAAGAILSDSDPVPQTEAKQSELQRRYAVKLLLQIGSVALAKPDHVLASQAYETALTAADEPELATASLGAAWAAALAGDRPLEAARKLARFVDQFPGHSDAARASRASAACLVEAGRPEDATAVLADLLNRWPNSEAACAVVENQTRSETEVERLSSPVRNWLLSEASVARAESLDLRTVRMALMTASAAGDHQAWSRFATTLARRDDRGQATSDTLQALSDQGQQADAERLATTLISPPPDASVTPQAREAACRWAGRTRRWSMLALASESESPQQSHPSRTPAVERLFAESLMQTGRAGDSRQWWNHLVHDEQAEDFATLLRCAETETAYGDDLAAARQRIGAARDAAGDDAFQNGLVNLLDAELAIRELQFDRAREQLESVVRSTGADPQVRARAQWLIGETHYLQQNFASAIEAYRRVEGIDAEGSWIAAALIQAGKSFEQLGRTREAAVCYLGLLDRFGESAHAVMARQRLAAISPGPTAPLPSSEPTIRR